MINTRNIIIAIVLSVNTMLAQNGSWWSPEFPFQGDTIKVCFNAKQNSEIPDNATSLVLHWGVNEQGEGNWQTPPVSLWPAGTVLHVDNIAARSPMTKVDTVWQLMIPTDQTISTLHYVVNTGTPATPGSSWGHSTGGKNWNINLLKPGMTAVFVQPQIDTSYGNPKRSPVIISSQDSLDILGLGVASGTTVDSMWLFVNDSMVAAVVNDTITYTLYALEYPRGYSRIDLIAKSSNGLADTSTAGIMINLDIYNEHRPEGIQDGINYLNDTSVTLSLFAPHKNYVYLLGDFNDWQVDTLSFMHRHYVNDDSVHWWITLNGLTPGNEYAFQYLVDGELRIADPYTEKVLDPWNDQYISESTYPGLKEYPAGKTGEIVSIFETGQTTFDWIYTPEYQRPPQQELVIYELLLRDFLAAHDFTTLQDTLNYLDSLGVNAVELMPVNEFEGNNSWGYNPSFYFAVDKYYGPADDLKRFIDECHRRGMAVILDMVLNHSFGQSPLVRLYWDDINSRPAANNPWFNPTDRHPYSVGYDFNHASLATQTLVDRVNAFWLSEYKIDGFRYDLSKGFTQKYTTDVGAWGAYDASRIAILKRMADKVWQADSSAYVILEHFADNGEEIELSNYGMLLWGNLNYNYNEATMGYNEDGKSDFSWGYYKTRGWSKPGLVTYMESHDEERLMYKNLTYGNASGNYNIKNLETALNRIKLASAFFFSLPGPKMLWKHGELGYDYSIDYNGRLGEKPICWDYLQEPLRRKLYKTLQALLKLRNENEIFRSTTTTVGQQLLSETKRINLSHSGMNAVIIGNFDIVVRKIDPNFQYGGNWYDYFTGDTLQVTNPNDSLVLKAGEFHIYTDKKLASPEDDILNHIDTPASANISSFSLWQNYPNPFNPVTNIYFHIPRKSDVTLKIFDLLGREITTLIDNKNITGSFTLQWEGRDSGGNLLSSGIYIYKIQARSGNKVLFEQSRKMILLK
jgi:1,4-alpha-glucan branching enzyme